MESAAICFVSSLALLANSLLIFASSDARGFQTGWTGVLLVPNDLRKGSISETVLPVSDEHQAPGITNELSVSRMRVGDTLTLEANVRGSEPFVFQWFKNGKELNADSNYNLNWFSQTESSPTVLSNTPPPLES